MHKLKNCPACGRPRTKKWLEDKEALRIFRLKDGQRRAKASGVKLGRPRKVDYKRIKELRIQGLSMGKIAKELGCSSATIFAAINAE